MLCPSKDCGSSNVEHLPHYWASLPGDSPNKARYAEPAEGNVRARLILAAVAVVGVVVLATGGIALGLAMLAVGGAGGLFVHGQIQAAEHQRSVWSRSRICLACTHLWQP
jgi:hypothetical protein